VKYSMWPFGLKVAIGILNVVLAGGSGGWAGRESRTVVDGYYGES